MGGRYWNYFVPYEHDVEAALAKLRNETFRAGGYSHCELPSAGELEEDPDLAEDYPTEKPQTIEELLEQQAEEGTNSIIDITHTADSPEFGAVVPMPTEVLHELFGTDQPTHEMVERKRYRELADHPLTSEKWEGVYFTVYRNGKPDEIFFAGCSGDH